MRLYLMILDDVSHWQLAPVVLQRYSLCTASSRHIGQHRDCALCCELRHQFCVYVNGYVVEYMQLHAADCCTAVTHSWLMPSCQALLEFDCKPTDVLYARVLSLRVMSTESSFCATCSMCHDLQ
jgi:hypothetical protein